MFLKERERPCRPERQAIHPVVVMLRGCRRTLSTLPSRVKEVSPVLGLQHNHASLARRAEELQKELDQLRALQGVQQEWQPTKESDTDASAKERTKFVGATSTYTTDLRMWYPTDHIPPQMPCFRLIDDIGQPVPGSEMAMPKIGREKMLAMAALMVRVQEFDKIFNDAQRQGRISFYMTSRGEEACSVASAAAIPFSDWVLPQYRELGAFFWRGLDFDDIANQLCSNEHDKAHGRQLPLHVGGREQGILWVKSTLGTHIPHAAGAAYAMRVQRDARAAIAYFGEGTTSEGDVPSGFNIAAVHGCPTIFFCRNNGYAISTRVEDQYKSEGIAPRGPAYGLPTIRVDGNDALAVFAATAHARQVATEQRTPVLIEAMTYRIGAHSTSDDDSKYRRAESPEEGWDSERAYWEARSPVTRFGRYLHGLGLWNAQMEDALRIRARREAIATLNRAQAASKPHVATLFTDVYDELPWSLAEQQSKLNDHLDRYGKHYPEIAPHMRQPREQLP